jgi:hypothetical protein
MSEQVTFQPGDKVRHRDAPPDGPVGTVVDHYGNTADGKPIYRVAYRSRTGSSSTTRYPVDSLVPAPDQD